MKESEAELIARCKKGDPDALKEIFDLYHKKVYRVAYGVLRHKEESLDVVQEVFIKLFRGIRNFEGKSGFYTYLYRMALNTAIDHARKTKKVFWSSLDEESQHLTEGVEKRPEQIVLQKELESRVKEAMERLPVEQRMALLFREVEGLSYQEIAETMGCSLGTVMSRLHYGRKKIQDDLKGYLDQGENG